MMKTTGIFVGLSTVDVIYSVFEGPKLNQKVAARSQQVLVGGPATNAAITFAHLGGKSIAVSPVGLHPLSAVIREELRHLDVEHLDLTPESQEPPPISSIWVDDIGHRSVVSANTVGRVIPAGNPDSVELSVAGVLMVDGHAMQACQEWARRAKSYGVPVVLDAGSWKAGTERLLSSVDVAVCSADFLPPRCSAEDDVISFIRETGVKSIAITHGADPIRYFSETGPGAIQVPQVAAVDTTGAGDIFHGAFCFFYANNFAFEEALRKAAAIASGSCRFPGTRKWMERED